MRQGSRRRRCGTVSSLVGVTLALAIVGQAAGLAAGPPGAGNAAPGALSGEALAAKVDAAERSFRPGELPAGVQERLPGDLASTRPHPFSIWRDVPALNPDGTVNAYVEIERGTLVKWEFSLAENRLLVDCLLPDSLGGYPVNYGFVPGTMAWDGDPFDHLLIGRPLPGGVLVRAAIVGTMRFADEKGLDSKVILAPLAPDGKALAVLDEETRSALEAFFNAYKRHEAAKGKFSRVLGFGDAAEGRRLITATAGFVTEARGSKAKAAAAGP